MSVAIPVSITLMAMAVISSLALALAFTFGLVAIATALITVSSLFFLVPPILVKTGPSFPMSMFSGQFSLPDFLVLFRTKPHQIRSPFDLFWLRTAFLAVPTHSA
ncbi:hypothetical protein PC116_g32768 [Phytophthora cactorum]|nr:hypothetical protein PC116_g32768 [Phytophthora cactorum]